MNEVTILAGGIGGRAAKTVLMLVVALLLTLVGVLLVANTGYLKSGLAMIAFFGGAGIPMMAGPLLRAGRYEVTIDHLRWRPYLGAPREIPIAEVAGLELDADTAAIKIGSHGLKMGSVARFEELWGTLVLLPIVATVPASQSAPVGPTTLMWPASGRFTSGVVVLRPEYVAFIGETFADRRSTAAKAGDIAATVALAFVGVGRHSIHAKLPIRAVLSHAGAASADRFDAIVALLADLTNGGVIAPRAQVGVQVTPGPHTNATVVHFHEGRTFTAMVDKTFGAYIAHVLRSTALRA